MHQADQNREREVKEDLSAVPIPVNEPLTQPLADGTEFNEYQVRLLTDARTAKWKLEQYEFAYDRRVRDLHLQKVIIEFTGPVIAVSFLFCQYISKGSHPHLHDALGVIGIALSLLILFAALWGALARWTDQIEKKREISRKARDLISQHQKITEVRPLPEAKIQKWIADCFEFEQDRKHELATVPDYYFRLAYQHVGNSYPKDSVVCGVCRRQWQANMNQAVFWTWLPFYGCTGCGVKNECQNSQASRTAS